MPDFDVEALYNKYKEKRSDIISKWIINDLLSADNFMEQISANDLAALADLVIYKEISNNTARQLIKKSLQTGRSPLELKKRIWCQF